MAFEGIPIGLSYGVQEEDRLPRGFPCGTAPQHLLSALPARDPLPPARRRYTPAPRFLAVI